MITVVPPFFDRPFTISVRVQTLNGLYASESATTIAPVRPYVIVYEDRPLTGVSFNRAVRPTAVLSGAEVTYRGYPLYVENPASLTYGWLLNGASIEVDTKNPRGVTFRKDNDTAGSFSVSFSFSNVAKIFEGATSKFIVAIQ